jgi:hypothetical protein
LHRTAVAGKLLGFVKLYKLQANILYVSDTVSIRDVMDCYRPGFFSQLTFYILAFFFLSSTASPEFSVTNETLHSEPHDISLLLSLLTVVCSSGRFVVGMKVS